MQAGCIFLGGIICFTSLEPNVEIIISIKKMNIIVGSIFCSGVFKLSLSNIKLSLSEVGIVELL